MTELGDFKRMVHEPEMEKLRRCRHEKDRLRAERQQAIDERDAALKRLDVLQRYDEDSLVNVALECDRLKARCEQAIDALRDIKNLAGDDLGKPDWDFADAIEQRANAALLNLGEQP